jgi:hypothetical protein
MMNQNRWGETPSSRNLAKAFSSPMIFPFNFHPRFFRHAPPNVGFWLPVESATLTYLVLAEIMGLLINGGVLSSLVLLADNFNKGELHPVRRHDSSIKDLIYCPRTE